MSSIWDDFRDFDLRREDKLYKRPELTWEHINNKYSFLSFEYDRVDDNNLLSYWYTEQYGNDVLTKRRCDFERGLTRKIKSNRISQEEKNILFNAIREKEKLRIYLEEHYKKIVKQYGQVTMVTILLHLPKNCSPRNGYVTEDFGIALNKLKSKFSLFKNKISSDRLYTPLCGYSRVTLVTEKMQPFYVINFFIKNKSNLRVNETVVINDLSSKWEESIVNFDNSENKDKDKDKDKDGSYITHCKELNSRLDRGSYDVNTVSPNAIIDLVKKEGVFVALDIVNNSLNEESVSDEMKSSSKVNCMYVFMVLSNLYNKIPGVRACGSSCDFTYINTAVVKERRNKRQRLAKRAAKVGDNS